MYEYIHQRCNWYKRRQRKNSADTHPSEGNLFVNLSLIREFFSATAKKEIFFASIIFALPEFLAIQLVFPWYQHFSCHIWTLIWIIRILVTIEFYLWWVSEIVPFTWVGDLQGVIIIITSLSFNKILLRGYFTDFLLLHISAGTRPPHIWTLSWAGGSCRESWSQSRRQGTTGNRGHPWPTGLERNFLGVRGGFRKLGYVWGWMKRWMDSVWPAG